MRISGTMIRRLTGISFALAVCMGVAPGAGQRVHAKAADVRPGWPGPGELFVGTCYQPGDRSPEEIRNDIALMKKAGFTVVRMGDLSWDYFEPREGVYTFDAFDKVIDQMHAAGIKVIVDIPGLPAPIWLHDKYKGVNLVKQDGTPLHPVERYMEDISDPDYQRAAAALADALTKRYARHPALIAIGYDNEIGNGFMSWSEADRQRFVAWLKTRYGSLDALNKAWATQRWSRTIDSWQQVQLPYRDGPGPFERHLDLHRFWSDVTVDTLRVLDAIREKNAPDKPAISNLWPQSPRKGFDYWSTYRDYVSFGAEGFYPGDPVGSAFDAELLRAGLRTPLWYNEFTVVTGGHDYGRKGRSRMWAYMGLIDGGQALLAWNFNSHLAAEEQGLFGLINHDNSPSWKLDEFARIAAEFRKIQSLGFPRITEPTIAFSYSFDSKIASSPPGEGTTIRQYYATPYIDQKYSAYGPIYNDNIDAAVIDVGHEDLSRYKLIVVSGEYLMSSRSADALRRFVKAGGTVIMTAQSAKVNDNNQWFNTPLPGGLSDVFGLKTNEFYHHGGPLKGTVAGAEFTTAGDFYEILEPSTARVIARFSNVDGSPPAVTVNEYGAGRAFYVGATADASMLQPLYRSLYASLGIVPGPETPEGVYARVVDGRTLYVNSTTGPKDIPVKGKHRGLLTGTTWNATLHLDGYGVDLLE